MEMNEAMETIQVQKAYMSSMVKQLDIIEHMMHQNTLAKETLEGLKGREEGTEILIPVGASTKAYATLKGLSHVIVDIGSGVEMEMTVDKAIEHHGSQVEKLTEEKGKLTSKLRELEQSTASLSNAVERAYAEQMQRSYAQHQGQGQNLFN